MSARYNIPPATLESIRSYVEDGIPPGDFLYAVLTHNLREAFARADEENTAAMRDIVVFCWAEIPAECWGNSEKVSAWMKKKAKEEPPLVT